MSAPLHLLLNPFKPCLCWLQHFAEMDRLYEAACEVEGAIEECIGAEEFTEAARLRRVHAEIQEQDDVYTIHKVSISTQGRL